MTVRITSLVAGTVLLGILAAPSHATPFFHFLNTEAASSSAFAGRIDGVDAAGTTRTTSLADIAPSPFRNIAAWKGFATDGKYYYLLNTDGGSAYRGHIDRVNLDGTGRTPIADIEPSPFSNVRDWKGFATDGFHFYLLNTENPGGFGGQIDRINMDGTGRVKFADVAPSPFNSIASWKGFATDGLHFYYLNTDGGSGYLGQIDRTDMDGTNRVQVADVDPSLFSNIGAWKGFAVPSVIPEPSTFLIWALGVLGLGWYGWQRRRRS